MLVTVEHPNVSISGGVVSLAGSAIADILIGGASKTSALRCFTQSNSSGPFAGSVREWPLEVACMAVDKEVAVIPLLSSSIGATMIAILFASAVVAGREKYRSATLLAIGGLCSSLFDFHSGERREVHRYGGTARASACDLYLVGRFPHAANEAISKHSDDIRKVQLYVFCFGSHPGLLLAVSVPVAPRAEVFEGFQSAAGLRELSLPSTLLNSIAIYSLVSPVLPASRRATAAHLGSRARARGRSPLLIFLEPLMQAA